MSALPITGVTVGETERFGFPVVTNAAIGTALSGWSSQAFGARTRVSVPLEGGAVDGGGADFEFLTSYGEITPLNLPFYFGDGLVITGVSAGTAFVGVPLVVNAAKTIAPVGSDFSIFRNPRVWAYVDGSGASVDFIFVDPYEVPLPQNTPFYFGGDPVVTGVTIGDLLRMGIIANIYQTPALYPVGIPAPDNAVGKPRLGETGSIDFLFEDEYVVPNPLNVPFYFGSQLAAAGIGFDAQRFGVPRVQKAALDFAPTGWSSLILGVPRMSRDGETGASVDFHFLQDYEPPNPLNTPFYFSLAGAIGTFSIDEPPMGVPLVQLEAQAVYPSGWNSAVVSGVNIPYRINGWYSDAYGTPRVANDIQNVLCGGIPPKNLYGSPEVLLRNRYVYAGLGVQTAFGGTRVAYFLRRIYPVQIQPPEAYGTAWVSRSPRYVGPSSYHEVFYTLPMIGFDRSAEAIGFEATIFGQTRVRDNTQDLYPSGFAGALGTPAVRNALQFILPEGFRTIQNDVRYGFVFMYNLRQYIEQMYDSNAYNIGEVFGYWLKIENARKYVSTIGTPMAAYGYTFVYNNARLLEPAGIAAPATNEFYKAGSVTHFIRSIPAEGIEPPYITSWLNIRNGGRLLPTQGFVNTSYGRPTVTKHAIERAGGIAGFAQGTPFVDFAIRTLTQRWPAGQPTIPLPKVQLWTRYVEAPGIPPKSVGAHALTIYRREAKTSGRDFMRIGVPEVRNLTPEIHVPGRPYDEHGEPSLRTQWRELVHIGHNSQLIGAHRIADRRQWIVGTGIPPLVLGDVLVTRIGAEPPSTKNIYPGSFPSELELASYVPSPIFNQQVIYHVSGETPSSRFGTAVVTSNVINVRVGIPQPHPPSIHAVALRIRKVQVGTGMDYTITVSKPRVTPHTVWVGGGAPEQAIINHYPGTQYPIDASMYPPKGVGAPTLNHRHRVISAVGYQHGAVERPLVELKDRYIRPPSFRPLRVGIVEVIGGDREPIEVVGIPRATAFGEPTVKRPPYTGPQTVSAGNIVYTLFGATDIMLKNRNVYPEAWYSQRMGQSSPTTRFYPNTLHVGFPDHPQFQGFDASSFGTQWSSHRIREITPVGFDMLDTDYTVGSFKQRMRVRLATVFVAPTQSIATTAMSDVSFGKPEARNARYVIRPDGNSETFRQGVH